MVALNTRSAGDADRPSTLLASTRRKGAASFMGAPMRRLDAGSSSRNQRQKRMFLKLAHSWASPAPQMVSTVFDLSLALQASRPWPAAPTGY
jgi:hypothetical protein